MPGTASEARAELSVKRTQTQMVLLEAIQKNANVASTVRNYAEAYALLAGTFTGGPDVTVNAS